MRHLDQPALASREDGQVLRVVVGTVLTLNGVEDGGLCNSVVGQIAGGDLARIAILLAPLPLGLLGDEGVNDRGVLVWQGRGGWSAAGKDEGDEDERSNLHG